MAGRRTSFRAGDTGKLSVHAMRWLDDHTGDGPMHGSRKIAGNAAQPIRRTIVNSKTPAKEIGDSPWITQRTLTAGQRQGEMQAIAQGLQQSIEDLSHGQRYRGYRDMRDHDEGDSSSEDIDDDSDDGDTLVQAAAPVKSQDAKEMKSRRKEERARKRMIKRAASEGARKKEKAAGLRRVATQGHANALEVGEDEDEDDDAMEPAGNDDDSSGDGDSPILSLNHKFMAYHKEDIQDAIVREKLAIAGGQTNYGIDLCRAAHGKIDKLWPRLHFDERAKLTREVSKWMKGTLHKSQMDIDIMDKMDATHGDLRIEWDNSQMSVREVFDRGEVDLMLQLNGIKRRIRKGRHVENKQKAALAVVSSKPSKVAAVGSDRNAAKQRLGKIDESISGLENLKTFLANYRSGQAQDSMGADDLPQVSDLLQIISDQQDEVQSMNAYTQVTTARFDAYELCSKYIRIFGQIEKRAERDPTTISRALKIPLAVGEQVLELLNEVLEQVKQSMMEKEIATKPDLLYLFADDKYVPDGENKVEYLKQQQRDVNALTVECEDVQSAIDNLKKLRGNGALTEILNEQIAAAPVQVMSPKRTVSIPSPQNQSPSGSPRIKRSRSTFQRDEGKRGTFHLAASDSAANFDAILADAASVDGSDDDHDSQEDEEDEALPCGYNKRRSTRKSMVEKVRLPPEPEPEHKPEHKPEHITKSGKTGYIANPAERRAAKKAQADPNTAIMFALISGAETVVEQLLQEKERLLRASNGFTFLKPAPKRAAVTFQVAVEKTEDSPAEIMRKYNEAELRAEEYEAQMKAFREAQARMVAAEDEARRLEQKIRRLEAKIKARSSGADPSAELAPSSGSATPPDQQLKSVHDAELGAGAGEAANASESIAQSNGQVPVPAADASSLAAGLPKVISATGVAAERSNPPQKVSLPVADASSPAPKPSKLKSAAAVAAPDGNLNDLNQARDNNQHLRDDVANLEAEIARLRAGADQEAVEDTPKNAKTSSSSTSRAPAGKVKSLEQPKNADRAERGELVGNDFELSEARQGRTKGAARTKQGARSQTESRNNDLVYVPKEDDLPKGFALLDVPGKEKEKETVDNGISELYLMHNEILKSREELSNIEEQLKNFKANGEGAHRALAAELASGDGSPRSPKKTLRLPPEVIELRQEVKKKQVELTKLRASWKNRHAKESGPASAWQTFRRAMGVKSPQSPEARLVPLFEEVGGQTNGEDGGAMSRRPSVLSEQPALSESEAIEASAALHAKEAAIMVGLQDSSAARIGASSFIKAAKAVQASALLSKALGSGLGAAFATRDDSIGSGIEEQGDLSPSKPASKAAQLLSRRISSDFVEEGQERRRSVGTSRFGSAIKKALAKATAAAASPRTASKESCSDLGTDNDSKAGKDLDLSCLDLDTFKEARSVGHGPAQTFLAAAQQLREGAEAALLKKKQVLTFAGGAEEPAAAPGEESPTIGAPVSPRGRPTMLRRTVSAISTVSHIKALQFEAPSEASPSSVGRSQTLQFEASPKSFGRSLTEPSFGVGNSGKEKHLNEKSPRLLIVDTTQSSSPSASPRSGKARSSWQPAAEPSSPKHGRHARLPSAPIKVSTMSSSSSSGLSEASDAEEG